ncbi:fumarate reductase flavoprotein subunit [Thalassobaculum fulvum]|uniref:Fumarate reductase flavoprotein subunit n=1 Tax=Thalassobaculum fulvum TaxID=1633335 RepID=A0A919CS58_9PROT|nr:FAD-dependent oxidoreductase [Thalassobaculum fulvum]GHD62211.1 fumarate reductase flavoprotein subunit [Thalassobaculum fulvum]
MSVLAVADADFGFQVPVLVIGGGACGMVAALAAADAGAEVVVLERDPVPSGSTALSSGFIPACGTRLQAAAGVADSVELMAADIQRKNAGRGDPAIVEAVCRQSGRTIDWLAERWGLPFVLLDGFLYPGHSVLRMHAHPDKTGAALLGALRGAVERAGVEVLTSALVSELFADADGRVAGVRIRRPDGAIEDIGCGALVLACNGYGGNPDMVRQYIPEMADALYFGHTGNQGDAVRWGEALGGEAVHMTAYQGHGSVAHPHGVLITWALMMEGGIQVNRDGRRFSDEHHGYSEQAVSVLAQPGGIAFDLYDERLHRLGMDFDDYRAAEKAGAVRRFETLDEMAAAFDIPAATLKETVDHAARCACGEAVDPFGRDFAGKPPLQAPFYAVRVTGALFHTQGGLRIDAVARVLRRDGTKLPNLFAGGGAACGVSGTTVEGYLSGNGLLTAVTLGHIAGTQAAGLNDG